MLLVGVHVGRIRPARGRRAENEVSGVDPNQMHDVPSAYVRLTRDGKDEGTWLLSVWYTDSYFNLVQEITSATRNIRSPFATNKHATL